MKQEDVLTPPAEYGPWFKEKFPIGTQVRLTFRGGALGVHTANGTITNYTDHGMQVNQQYTYAMADILGIKRI